MKFKCLTLLLGVWACLIANEPIAIDFEQLPRLPYSNGATLRQDPLFVDDFLTLHILLRMAQPSSVFEIGTCTGEGTRIIKNAVGEGVVYSLELPFGQSSYDIDLIGERCDLPYVQLIGDSSTFNYSAYYPIEAWFIDGAHDYEHVFYETKQALLSHPSLIVWHDADIPEVYEAIKQSIDGTDYFLFRVEKTRIAFAIPFTSDLLKVLHD